MNDSTEIASYVYLNQERLYAMLTATRAAQIDLSVNLRNWGSYQEAGCVAYYGTASAQEVVKWYQDHGELLFSRNIRGALVGTDVNDGIITTAREDLSRFWFFNNGVTVIAESFEQAPYVNQKSGNFNFRRANVINGAQTVSSLARASIESPSLALFSPDVSGSYVWVAVELMRWADQALSMARDRYDGRERLIQGPGGCPDAARRRRAQPRRAQGVPRGLSCAAVQESVEVQGHRHQAPGLPLQGRRKEHLTRRFPQRGSE